MKSKTRQVLIMKANGMMSKNIADELGLNRRTVEYHLDKAREDMDAKSVYHAIAKAVRDGVILAGEIGCVMLLSWSCLFSGANVDVRRGPNPPTISRTVRRETLI